VSSRTRWRVFHRASLGVAGLDAQQRFGISAGVLSLLGVVQLAVYAGMQVPVGVVLDWVGSRRMIVAGAVFMAGGQLLMATAGSLSLGLGGPGARRCRRRDDVHQRAATGPGLVPRSAGAAGDPADRACSGRPGQIVAAFPLVAGLHAAGWTPTFDLAAGVGLLAAVAVAVGPAQRAARGDDGPADRTAGCAAGVVAGARHPASVSRPTSSPPSPATCSRCSGAIRTSCRRRASRPLPAGGLLTLLVVAGMGIGPLLGAWPGGGRCGARCWCSRSS
jgi:hypothetical protein